jgi:hypothetical protein
MPPESLIPSEASSGQSILPSNPVQRSAISLALIGGLKWAVIFLILTHLFVGLGLFLPFLERISPISPFVYFEEHIIGSTSLMSCGGYFATCSATVIGSLVALFIGFLIGFLKNYWRFLKKVSKSVIIIIIIILFISATTLANAAKFDSPFLCSFLGDGNNLLVPDVINGSPGPRSFCYDKIARKHLDLNLCSELNPSGEYYPSGITGEEYSDEKSEFAGECYKYIADTLHDVNACSGILNRTIAENCYSSNSTGSEKSNSNCETLSDTKAKNYCFSAANQTRILSYCKTLDISACDAQPDDDSLYGKKACQAIVGSVNHPYRLSDSDSLIPDESTNGSNFLGFCKLFYGGYDSTSGKCNTSIYPDSEYFSMMFSCQRANYDATHN